ncbi:GH22714 [Drosophila grimshawi]|uniref:GH22714 n=1 Tax=Drosophila grimshawi TaxID=7222 RepID=B4JWM4_DROGR|nr:GH22714 [Drosophila grimshawi]
MAATPPMPPGANNFQLNGNSPEQQQQQQQEENKTSNKSISNNNNNNKTPNIAEALHQSFQFKALLNADEKQERDTNSNINSDSNSNSNSDEQSKSRLSCACTNISIMHLFHEMKQEFPTLPDALVTQCVNENCHQRDNCIQMLRKELSLHPSPVQSYPAKVVQQQQHLQQRPLKPLRAAPATPPTATPTTPKATPITTPTTPTPPMPPTARPRPTTLNLQRQINAQLQQKLQQRQLQQQQQLQALTTPNKPLRRAPPLPPLPPPRPATTIATTTTASTTTPSFSNDSSCLTSPLSSSESELSLNVSLSSPTTAAQQPQQQQQRQIRSPIVRHRSEINLQPEPPYAREFLTNAAVAVSPVAVSPVAAVAISPTTTTATTPSSSGQSTPSGNPRKSFTSLNLTLRQPLSPQCGPNNNNSNNNHGIAVQPSTIDITAGPAASGNGSSGITYSSSSFDARRGTHKNFQLTVTDEGSVFTAGCVRPQTPLYPPCAMLANDVATPPTAATTAAQQQQQQLWEQLATAATADMNTQVFPYATLAQKYVVATNYNNNHLHNSNNNNSNDNSPSVTHMPLYEGIVPESDRAVHAATIERQKTRRDKLANALRDNKKRLLSLEQEINILTEPVPLGESERLDRDIKKLTDDCQRLLNIINDPQLNGTAIDCAPNSNSMNRQLSAPAGAQVQPFQQQRTTGQLAPPANVQSRNPMPPNSLRLHSVPSTATQPHLDFVQHHASSVSAPSSACLTPQMQQQQMQQQQMQLEPPPTYAQYYQFQQFLRNQRAAAAAAGSPAFVLPPTAAASAMGAMGALGVPQQHEEEEESLSESEVDEGEEPLDMWACNLCTFRNHPQLNICEACDNVRIQPGMIRILHSEAAATPSPTPTPTMAATAAAAALHT